MEWVYNDGGRAEAGFRGEAPGDCVTRAIAIATRIPYRDVYNELNARAKNERLRTFLRSSSRTGVHRRTYEKYLLDLGWVWCPTMQIGQGCSVHLREDELPSGVVLVRIRRHLTAVVDGVIHDTNDPSLGGNRCVYGYYEPTPGGKHG